MVFVQNLGQIRSNIGKKVKKLALSISLFYGLHEEYLLKQKVAVVTSELKFKANIARNVRCEEH